MLLRLLLLITFCTSAFAITLDGTTLYVIEGSATTNARNIRSVDPVTGSMSGILFTTSVGGSAAMAINRNTNVMYYVDRTTTPNVYKSWDGTTESGVLGSFAGTSPANPVLRMGFNGNTAIVIDNNNNIFSFTAGSPSPVSLGAVSFQGTSPSGITSSGDVAFDASGHGWAIFGNSLYRLDFSSSPIRAFPIGQVKVSGVPLSTATYTVGAIAFDSLNRLVLAGINVAASTTTFFSVNMNDASATSLNTVSGFITDFASGNTPPFDPSMVVTKTVSPATAKPGDTLTYTINVLNNGSAPAVLLTLQDAIPTGTTYVANSATLNGVNMGAATYPFTSPIPINGLTASPGAILAGAAFQATITYQVVIGTSTPPTSISNIGTVGWLDGPSGGVSSPPSVLSVTPAINSYKSVKLTDADGNGVATAGDTLTWTIQTINTTIATATNAQITDTLPAGITLVGSPTIALTGAGTAATLNTSYTGATPNTNLLNAGASIGASGIVTITITTKINSGFVGNLSNQATITASDLPAGGTTSDNIDTTTTGLPAGITVPPGSLAQTQTATLDPTILSVISALPRITLAKTCTNPATCTTTAQQPGTDLTYSISYTNTGGANANNVIVSDAIPTNTDFKLGSATSTPGTSGLTFTIEYSNDNGVTWTYTPTSGGGGAASGYDRNVTTIRWRVTAGNLTFASPNNTGSVSFITKIR